MNSVSDADLRRLRWRCRRGLLENDLLLTRFLDRHAAHLDGAQLAVLNELLEWGDNDLWDVLSGRESVGDARFVQVVALVRDG